MVHKIVNLLAYVAETVLTYCMTHAKIVLIIYAITVIAICLIDYKSQHTTIFGFWWNLNLMIDRVINIVLALATLGIIMEIILLWRLAVKFF